MLIPFYRLVSVDLIKVYYLIYACLKPCLISNINEPFFNLFLHVNVYSRLLSWNCGIIVIYKNVSVERLNVQL